MEADDVNNDALEMFLLKRNWKKENYFWPEYPLCPEKRDRKGWKGTEGWWKDREEREKWSTEGERQRGERWLLAELSTNAAFYMGHEPPKIRWCFGKGSFLALIHQTSPGTHIKLPQAVCASPHTHNHMREGAHRLIHAHTLPFSYTHSHCS